MWKVRFRPIDPVVAGDGRFLPLDQERIQELDMLHAGRAGLMVIALLMSSTAAAAMTSCGPSPYIVFFDLGRDEITEFTARILDVTLETNRSSECQWARVTVAGHADRSGPAAHNDDLSRRRAVAVARYLEARGVRSNGITIQSFGESRPLVETEDGRREPQNRRVELFLSYGS